MPFRCPTCGSRRLRESHSLVWKERLLTWGGWYFVRCRDCEARFSGHYLMPDSWFYAKCPRCYRTDLNTWDPRYYNPGWWTRWKLKVGAKCVRCEACRCNFASFRPRKAWYRRPLAAKRPHKTRESPDHELPDFDPAARLFPEKENGSK